MQNRVIRLSAMTFLLFFSIIPVKAQDETLLTNLGDISDRLIDFRGKVPGSSEFKEYEFSLKGDACVYIENASKIDFNIWILDNAMRPVHGPTTAWAEHSRLKAHKFDLLPGVYLLRIKPRFDKELGATFRVRMREVAC